MCRQAIYNQSSRVSHATHCAAVWRSNLARRLSKTASLPILKELERTTTQRDERSLFNERCEYSCNMTWISRMPIAAHVLQHAAEGLPWWPSAAFCSASVLRAYLSACLEKKKCPYKALRGPYKAPKVVVKPLRALEGP